MPDSLDLATAVTASREKTKQEPVGNGTDSLEMVMKSGPCSRTIPALCHPSFSRIDVRRSLTTSIGLQALRRHVPLSF